MQAVDPALIKSALRKELRAARRAHVAALDPRIRALTFLRPPSPLLALVPSDAIIGLYHAGLDEAPAGAYARFFHDAGHGIALPWFAARGAPMEFRLWRSPHIEELLEPGPFGILQPLADAGVAVPTFLLLPLVGFSAEGARLGQGGGHYDRWLADHRGTAAVGMAWDCQKVDSLPDEAHDQALTAVVTPTRLYGPFEVGH
ncbi:5-formyltetrahydrofolate cyclo-ligase [Novosphingobium sp. Chol11]|uniref:5-formyltetrahydrofolate cyclo-ligase n=1 Tax=Novosphingobium sp. Chol11 TaxID=1385763 RepID=UPI0025F46067|nr:5-formyltetrahydrofolate cyclo-ligase [Novosphingobium sp. Chol11]